MKKLFFFIAALTLSFAAHAAVVNVEPGEDTLEEAVAAAQPGDELVLTTGSYELGWIGENGGLILNKEGLVLKAAADAKPVISFTDAGATFKVEASTTFDGLTFDGGEEGVGFPITVYQSSVKTIEVLNCEFKNYTNFAISDQWSKGCHIDSLKINNCLFHDGGQAVVISKYGFEEKQPCDYFEMKNSTMYNITHNEYKSVIHISALQDASEVANKVILDHLTIWNYNLVNGNAAIEIRKFKDLTITNSIIGNPESRKAATYLYGGTVSNVINFNATLDTDAANNNCFNEDPLFVDAANGNFALEEGSPAIGAATDGSNLGDPRWNAPAVEEPAGIEVVLEDAYKEVYLIWNRANFIGTHATYGNISVQVNNYNGYGTYAEGVSSRIGDVRVNGSATFENKGETDLLTATLTDEEGTVYIVKAEVPTPKTYEVVATNAAYVNVDQGWSFVLTVNGLTVGEEELTLTVYWDGVGGSEEGYEASAGFEGSIQGMIFVDKGEDDVLSFEGELKDASDNSYIFDFEATPKAAETYTLTFEDMLIEPGQWDDNLHISAENEEYAIEFQLFGGKTKGYGEYGFTDDYPDVDEIYLNEEYATMAEGTVANYYLNEDTRLATIELTVVLGIDTYNITLTGQPLVNPEDIKPTDTINITMTEATIGLYMGMPKVAASSNEAELSIVLVGENPYLATVEDFSAASYLVTTAGSLTFLRGGLEIVEVGDVKIAYIGVLCSDHKWYNITLTTGTELPTALDNVDTTVAPAKVINNGQLIIIRNGVQYNAQGAIVK